LSSENKSLLKENERLRKLESLFYELDAKIAALWPSSFSNSIQDCPAASLSQT